MTAATRPRMIELRQVGGQVAALDAVCVSAPARAFASARLRGRERGGCCRCDRPGCRGACVGASSWSGPSGESSRSSRRPAGRPLDHVRARGRSRGSARPPDSRPAPPAGTRPTSSASSGRAPSGAASPRTRSTTSPSGTASGSWTLVETWVRPLESSSPIARTPGSPPPDSRRPAATARASSRSPLSSSTLKAASGGRAVTSVAPARAVRQARAEVRPQLARLHPQPELREPAVAEVGALGRARLPRQLPVEEDRDAEAADLRRDRDRLGARRHRGRPGRARPAGRRRGRRSPGERPDSRPCRSSPAPPRRRRPAPRSAARARRRG